MGSATGEAFLASEALVRGLVDKLGTSDEYLRQRAAEGLLVIELRPVVPKHSFLQELWGPLSGNKRNLTNFVSTFAGKFMHTGEAVNNSSEVAATVVAATPATALAMAAAER